MEGYRESPGRQVLSWIGIIFTLGLLRFIFYFYPTLYLKATHSKTSLAYAQKLLITDIYETKRTQFVCSVKILDLTTIKLSFQNFSFKESSESSRFVDEQFESIFQNDNVLYFEDGNYQVLGDRLRITNIKKLPYVWDEERNCFSRIAGVGPGLNHQDIHHFPQYSELQRQIMRAAYGENVLEVPDSSFLLIILKETFAPFYLLQLITAILWGITGNYIYTIILFIFTFLVILLTSGQTKYNQMQLKKSLGREVVSFKVLSGNEIQSVACTNLVPGDRILLPYNGCKVPCDGILLSGACIVNESMLTGESVPQAKTALPFNDIDYIEKDMGNHNLYNGTNMIRSQGSEPVQLLVTRTGFSTSQGSIVRSILYPRPLDYAFENSVVKFALSIFSFSLIGAIINDIIEITHRENIWKILINTIKIAIMLIPAIMPIISASKLVGMRRLMKKKIFCINPAAFNLAGYACCTCFDKTGTLTEDGLDLYAVVASNSARFSGQISGSSEDRPDEVSDLSRAMACCHSLVVLDNELIGDPIDIKMFEWTKWDFTMAEGVEGKRFPSVSPKHNKMFSMEMVHQNLFSSKLQRMSVVVRCSDEVSTLRLYCKGSPEIIASLSLPHTVPSTFKHKLESYTRRGFRVLALGTRVLKENSIDELRRNSREYLENQLEFLGLIVFENKLKLETIPTVKELKDAKYKIIMITGDNQQTAECVAKECGIINENQTIIELFEEDEQLKCAITKRISTEPMALSSIAMENGAYGEDYIFSISGNAWKILRVMHKDILPKILVKSAVFARMSSDQKKEVIVELSILGYTIVMCGDGANDCGALRAADVGISLSKNESSAAASFTSHVEDISCVPHVIRYGRCSLATSASFFKYMMMSSALMTIVERFMQGMNSNLSDGQIIYLNLISNTNFALWFPRSDAFLGPLPPHLPMNSVLSFPIIFSIVSNLLMFFGFQVGNYFLVRQFAWYKVPNNEISYESYAMFCTVAFQMIILAISQSTGYPFSMPVYKNNFLIVSLIVMLALDLFITIHPTKTITDLLKIPFPPKLDFPLTLIALMVINFILAMLLEKILVEKVIYKRCERYPYLIKTKIKQIYIKIEENLKDGYHWVHNVFHCSHKIENHCN